VVEKLVEILQHLNARLVRILELFALALWNLIIFIADVL
jgi:hypothetical protein